MSNAPEVIDLNQLPAIACPCGTARRAFAERDELPATVHLTHISKEAKEHYHKDHTEVYVILECNEDATIQLNGELYPVRPMMSVFIPPGVRHRAIGEMKVLIVCSPNFDASDEHFD